MKVVEVLKRLDVQEGQELPPQWKTALNDSHRRLTSPQLKRERMESCGVQSSSSTVRRRLVKPELNGLVARKKPLLIQNHKQNPFEMCPGNETLDFSGWHK